jgi:hypothetical protein
MSITSTAIKYTYRYNFSSEFYPQWEGSNSGRLTLAVDSPAFKPFSKTSPKKKSFSVFFNGTLINSKKICDLLCGVSEIVNARFNNPDWKRLADPVITVDKDRIRFEGFSGCCSACVRVD